MKIIDQLPALTTVAPGSKATLQIPTGPTYEGIIFTVTAAAGLDATDIGRIDVLLNGTPFQTFKDLTRLLDINSYYGRDADTVAATKIEFKLHFNRRELMDNENRKAPGWGTADVQNFDIEIQVAAAAPADIKIVAHAIKDPLPQPIGVFFGIKEQAANAGVAGDIEVSDILKGPRYGAFHLFKADCNAVELEIEGQRILRATKAVLERVQKGAVSTRVPVTAKATHVDFITDGNLLECLRTDRGDGVPVQDMRLKMTMGTTGAYDIVTEYLATLPR